MCILWCSCGTGDDSLPVGLVERASHRSRPFSFPILLLRMHQRHSRAQEAPRRPQVASALASQHAVSTVSLAQPCLPHADRTFLLRQRRQEDDAPTLCKMPRLCQRYRAAMADDGVCKGAGGADCRPAGVPFRRRVGAVITSSNSNTPLLCLRYAGPHSIYESMIESSSALFRRETSRPI